jgi:hypothetical protein
MPANSCAVEATFANTACKQQNISTLYQNNHRWLSGWLYQKLNCSEQAADLAQDVFLRLLNRTSVVVQYFNRTAMIIYREVIMDDEMDAPAKRRQCAKLM